jgi:hypothetical protein
VLTGLRLSIARRAADMLSRDEAWRLFAPGSDAEDLIFPTGTG